jgi:hypothetical protein
MTPPSSGFSEDTLVEHTVPVNDPMGEEVYQCGECVGTFEVNWSEGQVRYQAEEYPLSSRPWSPSCVHTSSPVGLSKQWVCNH